MKTFSDYSEEVDLQFIRINGTLVGGTIGLLLWLFSQIPALLHLHI